MSAPLFTTGPWKNGLDDIDCVWSPEAGEGNVICLPPDERLVASFERWRANANLISSAPDLFEAVIELTDAMLRYEMDVDADAPAAHREMMRKAYAALAKARGEANSGQDIAPLSEEGVRP